MKRRRRFARMIDPFIRLEPAIASPHAIGLGLEAPAGLPWYAGSEGQIAMIGREPLPSDGGDRLSLGGGLAACLAAAALFNQVTGYGHQRPVWLSAWNVGEGDQADSGPHRLGPVDVGDVLLLGAGGVGSSLAFWLSQLGVHGDWHVVDGDAAVLHNTNRCLGLFPHQAGSAQPRWYQQGGRSRRTHRRNRPRRSGTTSWTTMRSGRTSSFHWPTNVACTTASSHAASR